LQDVVQRVGGRHPAPYLMEETDRGIVHVKESLVHERQNKGTRHAGQTQRIVWTEKGM